MYLLVVEPAWNVSAPEPGVNETFAPQFDELCNAVSGKLPPVVVSKIKKFPGPPLTLTAFVLAVIVT
jgi:hypothetical protein